MTMSEGADLASWAQVMFVAPGLLQQPTLTIQDSGSSNNVLKNGKVVTPPVAAAKQLVVAGAPVQK